MSEVVAPTVDSRETLWARPARGAVRSHAERAVSNTASIPHRLHYVWIGSSLPDFALVAVRSGHRVCRPDETVLWTDGLASGDRRVAALRAEGVTVTPVGRWCFADLPAASQVAALYRACRAPAARSNLLRLAALWRLGGIYLDTDTVVLRALDDLRREAGFCGAEPVSTPGTVWRSRHPLRWMWAGVLHALRAGCVRHPRGPWWFRRLGPLYHHVVSNAVLGATARHPVVGEALRLATRLPAAEQRRRYALGVHLLQRLLDPGGRPDLRVLPPPWFYPLGPEVAAHWFRPGSARHLPQWVGPQTRVVHWYQSSARRHVGSPVDRAWLRAHPEAAYSRLAAPYLHLHLHLHPHPHPCSTAVTGGGADPAPGGST